VSPSNLKCNNIGILLPPDGDVPAVRIAFSIISTGTSSLLKKAVIEDVLERGGEVG